MNIGENEISFIKEKISKYSEQKSLSPQKINNNVFYINCFDPTTNTYIVKTVVKKKNEKNNVLS